MADDTQKFIDLMRPTMESMVRNRCEICGEPITNNRNGTIYAWETKNKVHTRCAQAWNQEVALRMKQYQEAMEKQKRQQEGQ